MGIENYIRYKWKTCHKNVIINNQTLTCLYKKDDGGALFRQKRTFSFDYNEFRHRYLQNNFNGILLNITNDSNCNYSGWYFLSLEDLTKNKIIRTTSKNCNLPKIHIEIKYWKKLTEISENNFINSTDIYWASRLEKSMLAGNLTGLKDQDDIERYHEELAAGIYNKDAA